MFIQTQDKSFIDEVRSCCLHSVDEGSAIILNGSLLAGLYSTVEKGKAVMNEIGLAMKRGDSIYLMPIDIYLGNDEADIFVNAPEWMQEHGTGETL